MPPPTTTTYGKRSMKRKNNGLYDADPSNSNATATPEGSDDDELLLQAARPAGQKKRRIEPMQRATDVSKRDLQHPLEDGAVVTKPKPPAMAGSSAPAKVPSLNVNHADPPPKPERQPPIFQDTNSESQPRSMPPASPRKVGSPIKLAKCMLSRSKTETAVETPTNSFALLGNKSPSMPLLLSPQKELPPSQPLSRSLTRTNSLQDVSSATAPTNPSSSIFTVPAPAPASSSKAVSRTYAGRSRSYLVPLGPADTPDGTEDDDEFGRESYATLRQRWGVDESEDDPYDLNANDDQQSSQSPRRSPIKGRTSGRTPSVSPSKEKSTRAGIQQPKAPPLPPNMMNPLKSITELRNKGESRRFLDEVAYLLDGMDKSQGVGLVRSSALELVTKMCDGAFFRKSKAADVFVKVYNLFLDAGIGQGDKVLDTLFAFFVALVAKDQSSLTELACQAPTNFDAKGKSKAPPDDLVGILFSLLESYSPTLSDPLSLVAPEPGHTDVELKKAGLGKKEKAIMTAILSTIRTKSGVFPADVKITTPLLVTRILHTLPPSFIPQHHLTTFLRSLRESLRPLEEWRKQVISTLALDGRVEFESVYAHLRLLDLYLLGQWASGDGSSQQEEVPSVNDSALISARETWLVSGLVALGIRAEMAMVSEKGDDISDAGKCLESALRVLVSLTHGDGGWARSVALDDPWAIRFLMRVIARAGEDVAKGSKEAKGVVKEEEGAADDEREAVGETGVIPNTREKAANSLDMLCLSLALLTNLVQSVGDVKDVIRETYLDPSCRLPRAQCLDDCLCYQANNVSGMDVLVRLYVRQGVEQPQIKKEGDDEGTLQADADASFLRGHLAVLFGLCMRGSSTNQKALLKLLPGPQSNPKAKLDRLVDQARQFVTFFEMIEGEAHGSQRETSSRTGIEILRFLEDLASFTSSR